jgi:capsular exopolysaccharide synthesis family protein
LLDHLDNTIKHEEDLRQFSGLPVLGAVPFHAPSGGIAASPGGSGASLDLESHRSPRSAFAEATKNIRTSILLASADEPPRHLVVSSCEPNDGKSTVALNLGIVLTQSGRRVLLIDADLRRPRLHHAMGVDNVEGLSSLLTGNASLDQLIRNTVVPGLDLITSGPIPPNPSELLDSNGLKALLTSADLARRYDHVIFDSPPALSVSDAIILAARTDGMILVVRAGETSRDSLLHAAGRLRQARVRVIGTILNAVTHVGERYHYYYYGNDLPAARDRETASTSPGVDRVLRVTQRRRGGGRSA